MAIILDLLLSTSGWWEFQNGIVSDHLKKLSSFSNLPHLMSHYNAHLHPHNWCRNPSNQILNSCSPSSRRMDLPWEVSPTAAWCDSPTHVNVIANYSIKVQNPVDYGGKWLCRMFGYVLLIILRWLSAIISISDDVHYFEWLSWIDTCRYPVVKTKTKPSIT